MAELTGEYRIPAMKSSEGISENLGGNFPMESTFIYKIARGHW